jgi:hypothetical protein
LLFFVAGRTKEGGEIERKRKQRRGKNLIINFSDLQALHTTKRRDSGWVRFVSGVAYSLLLCGGTFVAEKVNVFYKFVLPLAPPPFE